MINIRLAQKPNLKGYTVLEGFPGAGLVGPMAISYIVEKLEMDYIGSIDSDSFPPLIAIHNNMPMPPVRIYASEKYKLVTVLAEFAIPIDITHELSTKFYDFIKTQGITRIISISGIPSQQSNIDNEVIFGVGSTDQIRKEITKSGIKMVGEGVATGVSALILMNAAMEGIPDINVLIPVDPNILDPKYAELAIKSINKLANLKVDVSELDKEAKEVEAKIRELVKRNKEVQDVHKRVVDEAGPSMYA